METLKQGDIYKTRTMDHEDYEYIIISKDSDQEYVLASNGEYFRTVHRDDLVEANPFVAAIVRFLKF